MNNQIIVSTHISSLNSPSPSSLVIQTARQNVPILSTSQVNDIPPEHAIVSSVVNTPTTGTIILRLIHGGLILELLPLSSHNLPLRIVFPAVVLPTPALFLWEEKELHVLAVTEIGSLHRIVVPIDNHDLWLEQTDRIWAREYLIQHQIPSTFATSYVLAHGTHSVAISLPNGALLRLEAETMSYDGREEDWSESISQPHASFLSSFTAFLPIQSGVPNASDIIALASHPWPTDIASIFTLSRDRTLRKWKAKLGCVASKSLPATPGNQDSSSSANNSFLLDPAYQNLVRVFSLANDDDDSLEVFVVTFIPTPSSTSGGYFTILTATSDHFSDLGHIDSHRHTAQCHLQDFVVQNGVISALWDKQGQTILETCEIDTNELSAGVLQITPWKSSHYVQQPELTPAFMEEQLLASGSMSEKFLQAIMRPGIFSSLTLRTALDRYIDACLSLPGSAPSQLLQTYPTLCENIAAVVGCTVTLNRDPHTGGFQHANYWTALKRDWEGFVARCREVERSARWPLAVGFGGSNKLIIIERERVGSLVHEDVPISLHQMLGNEHSPHQQFELLAILWSLRSKLAPRTLFDLEMGVTDLLHQEMAFSFAELLQDQTQRIKFKENLEEGAGSWFIGRLESIPDIDAATRVALDSIGALDLAVKREDLEVEAELLNPRPTSEWSRAQVAAYCGISIDARYELCLCLILLLFFVSDELQEWDPSLIAEVFAVFRGVAMLRLVSQRSLERDNEGVRRSDSGTEDVIDRLRNMNVSSTKSRTGCTTSLMQLLVNDFGADDSVAMTAHNFLDSTGLLQSLSPAYVTKHEVLLCERIRLLDLPIVAWNLLSRLPRTAAVTYLQSQIWIKLGRYDDAALLLEKLAGCFGISNLTLEDVEALSSVLTTAHPIDSQFAFYQFAANLFQNTVVQYQVHFSQLALQVAPDTADTSALWSVVVKGLTDLGLYEDAYASIMVTPFEKQKRDCASQLALRMCEEKAVDQLMTFDFAGVADEVEAALSFKARNTDPRVEPCYSRILYTWFTRRGDYRKASLTMYQRARKLGDSIADAASFISLAEDQLEAFSVSMNALSLVDSKNSWMLIPVVTDLTQKRQRLSRHIPESRYLSSKHDAEIVHLSAIEYESTLLRAQIDSIKRDPSLLSSPEFLLPPNVIIMRLAQASQYNQALAIARSLKVDMTDVFVHLTNQCIRLSRNPGAILQEDTTAWLLTDNTSSWQGTPADRGWRYLQHSLKRHDTTENDYRYSKAALETILGIDRSILPPPWLISTMENYQPEYLIRISLRYDNIADAVNYAYSLVLKSEKQLGRQTSRNASTTWLPYSLIDQVLTTADAQIQPPQFTAELRTAVNNRVKRMQKLSQN
ncbi:nucleoporin Nup120/160-domain-containing protein [Panaeolus papilionaceus]|nr:nucleoporin Nup120/160-domain-containing protein [Panaeolus papilionaceus]